VETKPKQLKIYERAGGQRRSRSFMESIEGQKIHGIVLTRLDRVERGLLGEWRSIGEGVCELVSM
jgi:putative component of toxin-antitoxin plasmid stabilization module